MTHTNNTNKVSLEKAKEKLSIIVDDQLPKIEETIRLTKDIFEDFKKHKVHVFDELYNLCLYADITYADLILLLEKFRLTDRSYEKSLFARLIALTIIEFIDDINVLLGRDLLKELTSNNFLEFIPSFKDINKQFSEVKKKNELLLRQIRNNTIAHKSKDALQLTNYIYQIDTEKIYDLAIGMVSVLNTLNDETTKVLNKMIDRAKENEINSR